MADATIKNIPRNPALGVIADWLMSAKKTGGTIGDFFLGKSPEVLDSLSYGFKPTTGQGMTFGVKPEAVDLINLTPIGSVAGMAGKPVAKMAGREIAKQVETGTGILGRNVIDPRMYIDDASNLARQKTQYELAHETAQKNAVDMLGLPPDNTAMDRARALGYDIEGYHGTGKVFNEMETNRRGVNFTTSSPDFANKYAGGEYSVEVGDKPNVIPTIARASKVFDYENPADLKKLAQNASLGKQAISQIKQGDWQRLEDRTILNTLKDLGYDGLYVKEEGVKNFAAFNPNQIRSRFAAFDPARVNEADLLGYATPAMMGTLATATGAGVIGANKAKDTKKKTIKKDKKTK